MKQSLKKRGFLRRPDHPHLHCQPKSNACKLKKSMKFILANKNLLCSFIAELPFKIYLGLRSFVEKVAHL